MAALSAVTGNADSEYGSDFDTDGEVELANLLESLTRPDDIKTHPEVKQYVLEDIEQNDGASSARNVAPLHIPHNDALAGVFVSDEALALELQIEDSQRRKHLQSVEVEYAEGSRQAWNIPRPSAEQSDKGAAPPPTEPPSQAAALPDPRSIKSPLKHFRTAPKKPLSVTDLISPAWCELQYFYNLAKFGRKRRTPAMKQGSAVHKVLERQVHDVVEVEVKTKEDSFGLRIWNIIQGLRTLRATGMTRELELWGIVEGQVVNGIIDVLSYTCPDPELEERTLKVRNSSKESETKVSPNQTTLTEFLKSSTSQAKGSQKQQSQAKDSERKVYITDVKTRNSPTMPSGSAMRPTMYQLMLYWNFLAALAAGTVDPKVIFSRYGIKPTKTFSDAFIAELTQLELDFQDARGDSSPASADNHPSFPSSQDSVSELLKYSSVSELWDMMASEFASTFPNGAASIGPVMGVEFRQGSSGAVMGTRHLVYDEAKLTEYVQDEMRWWRGEREAKGVDIEEAGYKCRICEFAEGCSWRKGKLEEELQKAKLKSERTRSLV